MPFHPDRFCPWPLKAEVDEHVPAQGVPTLMVCACLCARTGIGPCNYRDDMKKLCCEIQFVSDFSLAYRDAGDTLLIDSLDNNNIYVVYYDTNQGNNQLEVSPEK